MTIGHSRPWTLVIGHSLDIGHWSLVILQDRSRKKTPHSLRFLDALDAEAQGGQAHRKLFLSTQTQDLDIRTLQDSEQLVHHFRLRPEKALQILHPLEVGNDYAAR